MIFLDPVKNNVNVTVSTTYDASATSIVLSGGEGAKLPDPSTDGEFNLVWYDSTTYPDPNDDPNVEIVRVTAVSTDTLTVTRNQEGSGASTKNTGSVTYKMGLFLTKKLVDDIDEVVGSGLITLNSVIPTPTYVSTTNGVDTISFASVDVTDEFSPGKYVVCSSTAGSNLVYQVKSSTFSTDTTVELVGETSVSGTITAISYAHGIPNGETPWQQKFTSRLYYSSSTSVNHNTETLIPFNNESYDPNGDATTGASAKVTAPVSGYYRQVAQCSVIDFGSVLINVVCRIKNNSTIVGVGEFGENVSGQEMRDITVPASVKRWVNRGEDIEVYILHKTTDSGAATLTGSGDYTTFLEVEFCHV